MDSKFTTSSEDGPGSVELNLLSASRLAASGRLDEAKTLLSPTGVLPPTPQALDLLARIAVQTGDFIQARKLWQVALQNNPSFEPAQKALASLGSPWFAIAVIKRIILLTLTTLLGCFAFVGLLTVFQVAPSPTPETPVILSSRKPPGVKQMATRADPKPNDQKPSLVTVASKEELVRIRELQEQQIRQIGEQLQYLQSNQTNLLMSQKGIEDRIAVLHASILAQSSQQKESYQLIDQTRSEIHDLTDAYTKAQSMASNQMAAPRGLPPLSLAIGGISVRTLGSKSSIYFKEGLFYHDDHFKMGSKTLLESVGKALVQTQEKIKIVVVGYALNEPPTWPWQSHKSDAALAQLRAEAVKNVLQKMKLFPPGAVVATNGPSTDCPYPSETIRNRTTVLQICEP